MAMLDTMEKILIRLCVDDLNCECFNAWRHLNKMIVAFDDISFTLIGHGYHADTLLYDHIEIVWGVRL